MLEDSDTSTLITLPREACQEWRGTLHPFVAHPHGAERVTIALKSLRPDRIFDGLGWAHSVERLSSVGGGATVTIAAPLPDRLKRAASRRVADFLAGRHCAASALEAAGVEENVEIDISADGSPAWPEGFTGSITHTGRFATALVVARSAYLGVGIDSEAVVAADVAEAIRAMVLAPDEVDCATDNKNSALDAAWFITLAFSAKESVYKCLRPLADDFFEFHDVRLLHVDLTEGALDFQLERSLGARLRRGMRLRSRFSFDAGRVNTVTVLNRLSRSSV